MDGAPPVSADHLAAPYPERWELLKGVISWLYMEQEVKLKLKEIVEIMKANYQFYASETEYKSHFSIWKLKRALSTAKKEKISKTLETRAQLGKSSVVLHKGKVESHKIRRYLKEQTRRENSLWTRMGGGTVGIENLSGHALQCGNRIFMNWTMPAAVLRFLNSKATDHVSPYASAKTLVSDVQVVTPSSNAGSSPQNPSSPGNALSPSSERSTMTIAIKKSLKISRAHLFAQKRRVDLLRGMNLQEQCTTTDWLHQFWLYAFKTAKAWGRGPQVWNASNLRFNENLEARAGSLPGTPSGVINASERYENHPSPQAKLPNSVNIPKPSPLCRWSIHTPPVFYQRVASPGPAANISDPNDESTWTRWATAGTIHDFADRLQENIGSNEFSTFEERDLPLSSAQIARAAERSPEQLMEEAFGFSIMARNLELVTRLMEDVMDGMKISLHDLMFSEIVHGMAVGETSVRKLYLNHLNHTVLDTLMITILKGHTSCTPIVVDEAFKKEHRFAGEEVDICGRWDADSDCIRHLHARGIPTIPQIWKHMFCHTATQAITHCIGTLFTPYWRPDINLPSGLFFRRCQNETCGLKLQLKPLHTLVLTAVYLAQLGSDGENLFGMIACLLCLLGKGANPLLKADVSLDALLHNNDSQECSHSSLDPLELAQKIPRDLISKWPEARRTGWKIICNLLRLSQNEWDLSRPGKKSSTARASNDNFENLYSALLPEGIDEYTEILAIPVMDVDAPAGKEYQYQNEYMDDSEDDEFSSDEEELPANCPDHPIGYHPYQQNYFGKNMILATLWAAVQTELLTYRRLTESDPWISANFDMNSVLESLEKGEKLSIQLVSGSMMNPFCRCGVFRKSEDPACVLLEQASAHYFSNLEDYNRTTFLESFNDRVDMWMS